jgi:hypothetical protein
MTNDATVQAAQTAAMNTWNCLTGATFCGTNLSGQDLGTLTLGPGVYCYNADATLTGTLTLTTGGTYVFQIANSLTTTEASSVSAPSNARVYWAVGNQATFASDTAFFGQIYSVMDVSMANGATNDGGGVVSLHASISLDTNTVTGF